MAKYKNKTRKMQKVCQICGYSNTKELELHHILSRSIHPEYKSDPRNLICLCHDCHEYLHTIIQEEGKANYCDFLSLVKLYAHKGNKKNWKKKSFIKDVLQKAKNGYYNNNEI